MKWKKSRRKKIIMCICNERVGRFARINVKFSSFYYYYYYYFYFVASRTLCSASFNT